MKNMFDQITQWLRGKEETAQPKHPEPFPENAQRNQEIKEELENALEKSRKIAQRMGEAHENGTAAKQPAYEVEFMLEFHFKNRREADLDEINAALAQHKLSGISLEKYSGYLATETTTKHATGETSVRLWYGLDDCVLRCTPAQPGSGDIYQISAAVMDKDVQDCMAAWYENHADRTLRTLVEIHYDECYGVIVLHRARRESDAPIGLTGAYPGACGEGMTCHQEDDVLYIAGEGEIEAYAFYEGSSIRKVVIAPGCTGIGDSAFESCESLKTIELPNGLQKIGEGAFRGCDALTLRVPDSVTEIGGDAFDGVMNLIYDGPAEDENEDEWGAKNYFDTEAKFTLFCQWEIKGNILYIYAEGETPMEKVLVKGWHPMVNEYEMMEPWRERRKQIRHVVIAPGCTRISADAFSYCGELETVSIPDTVQSIGKGAFAGCKKLRSIEMPDSVTAIEKNAFAQCESLTFVKIPDGVTEIAAQTFEKCSRLERLCIPDGLKTIGSHAFYECGALKQMVIPGGVTYIDQHAFEKCSALEAVRIPGGVKVISGGMFCNCAALERVILDEGVEKIEWSAFFGCSQLKEMDIPASMTEITGSAFGASAFNALIRVHPKNTRYKVEGELLLDKGNKTLVRCLTEIKGKYCIPSGIEEIGEYAFFRQSGMTEVSIPDGVKVIGSDAFSRTGLVSVDLPESVEIMKSFAFSDCSSLAGVKIPGSVKELERFTFQDCTQLTSVDIGEGVMALDANVFSGCSKLQSIDLPGSMERIDSSAFLEIENLCAIGVRHAQRGKDACFVSRDGVLFRADMSKLVCCPNRKAGAYQIPDTVKVIEDHAFDGCARLTQIQLPEGVKGIGRYAFSGCSALDTLRIPADVKYIGYDAFKGVACIRCLSPAFDSTWLWGARSRV